MAYRGARRSGRWSALPRAREVEIFAGNVALRALYARAEGVGRPTCRVISAKNMRRDFTG